MSDFLRGVCEEGKARVGEGEIPVWDLESDRYLAHCDGVARTELAGDPPAFSLPAARWAAGMIYQACRFVMCRDLGEAAMEGALRVPCPDARGPSADWSADLMLRQLPELFRLARRLSATDPLLRELRQLAVQWPLSSVGIPGVPEVDCASFWEQEALRRLYVDRIVRAQDGTRLGDVKVERAVSAALGAHGELAPELASRLSGFPLLKDPRPTPNTLLG